MKARGFTLVETIAASAILAAGVAVIAAITSRTMDALRLDAEYARAWEVLDRQLTVIDYVGIDTIVQKGVTEGDFVEGDTAYRWYATITEEPYDRLKTVDITVTWQRGGRARSISAATMFNGSGQVGEQTELPTEESTDESGDTGSSSANGGSEQ